MKNLKEAVKTYQAPARRITAAEFGQLENKSLYDIIVAGTHPIPEKALYRAQGDWGRSYAVRVGNLLVGVTEKTAKILTGGEPNAILSLVFRTGTGTSGNAYMRLQPTGGNYEAVDGVEAPESADFKPEDAVEGVTS